MLPSLVVLGALSVSPALVEPPDFSGLPPWGPQNPIEANRSVLFAPPLMMPRGGAWGLTLNFDYASAIDGGAPALKLELDQTSGNNGTRLQLTITVLRADTHYGGEVFVLESFGPDGVMRSYWNGIVGN